MLSFMGGRLGFDLLVSTSTWVLLSPWPMIYAKRWSRGLLLLGRWVKTFVKLSIMTGLSFGRSSFLLRPTCCPLAFFRAPRGGLCHPSFTIAFIMLLSMFIGLLLVTLSTRLGSIFCSLMLILFRSMVSCRLCPLLGTPGCPCLLGSPLSVLLLLWSCSMCRGGRCLGGFMRCHWICCGTPTRGCLGALPPLPFFGTAVWESRAGWQEVC